MKAPIKKIQNKFRYQIIMRLSANATSALDYIYKSVCEVNSKTVSAFVEVNPNNLS